jgi:hypothetical protein
MNVKNISFFHTEHIAVYFKFLSHYLKAVYMFPDKTKVSNHLDNYNFVQGWGHSLVVEPCLTCTVRGFTPQHRKKILFIFSFHF